MAREAEAPAWTPPPRDGVGASRVRAGSAFASVLAFLQLRFPAVQDWPARLERGDVLNAQGHRLQAEAPCPPGTLIWYWRSPPAEARVPFDVELLHHDAHLVVVDKPHFLPVTPSGRHLQETVLVRLKRQLGIETLTPIHRLDLDTAGVLAFSVQSATRHAYQSLFAERRAHKEYEAVAPWRAELALPFTHRCRLEEASGASFMQMQVVPGEPNAETHVELIARLEPTEGAAPLALYRLTPLTGRKHQLRAQMNALGLPIVFDRIYPQLLPDALPDYQRPLQLLARELRFEDPISGLARCFRSKRQLSKANQVASRT